MENKSIIGSFCGPARTACLIEDIANDYRDDSIVKQEILERIRSEWGEPFMVFEDRARVVQMWRDNGVRCMHVEPGLF